MRIKFGSGALIVIGTILAVFCQLPSAGYSFWEGYDEELAAGAPGDPQLVHDALLEGYLPGLSSAMAVHDTISDAEVGRVTVNKPSAWSGFTLLSSFGALCAFPENPDGTCPQVPLPTTPFRAGLCKASVDVCPNPFWSYWALLIDMEGNLVKAWPIVGGPAEMLPTGNIRGGHFLPPALVDPPATGGVGGLPSLVEMDWLNATVWAFSGPTEAGMPLPKPGGAIVHHDHQDKDYHVYYAGLNNELAVDAPTGKTLVLSNHTPGSGEDGQGIRCGDTSTISHFPLLDDAIYEIDEATGEIAFAWYPCEHFDEMGFDAAAKEGLMNYQSNPAAGLLGALYDPSTAQLPTDWQHINAVSYLGPNRWYDTGDVRFHPDNIIFDSRTNNMIAIIARWNHPEAGIAQGDIVWKVGPQYKEGYPENSIGQIIGPHMAHMIPDGLPGAGNILVYDNGGIAGYGWLLPGLPGYYPNLFRDYSRIVEFNPVTLEKVWEYKNVEAKTVEGTYVHKFYSMLISGVQRLENGNTMICEGQPGRVFEVTSDGEIVWEYISEFGNGFPLGPAGFLGPRPVYRAYRVPYEWVADNLLRPSPRSAPARPAPARR